MSNSLTPPLVANIMAKLEEAKHLTEEGVEYWMAREISPIMGYPTWREFEGVIERARKSMEANGVDASHQIVETHKLMEVGRGAQIEGRDYFLSRGASYLIAMNGDPAKPEISGAQAYFAAQTRRMEAAEALARDEKRLELREKIKGSVRRVSSAAKDAGVSSKKQGIFHEQRYLGLYGKSAAAVKVSKGLKEKDNLLDHAGPLELSANDFQMNLAADVLARERVRGEQAAISKNLEVAKRVRRTMEASGATLPENLPLEEPITVVKKRLEKTKAISNVDKDPD